MNKTMTSMMALGMGAVAAYSMTKNNNNLMSKRGMKKMRKQIMKNVF